MIMGKGHHWRRVELMAFDSEEVKVLGGIAVWVILKPWKKMIGLEKENVRGSQILQYQQTSSIRDR